MRNRPWTRNEERLAAWWRGQGIKVLAIARRLNRTKHAVADRLHKLGVVVDPSCRKSRRSGYLRRVVVVMTRRGLNGMEIADRLGVSEGAVSRTRKAAGLPKVTHAERARTSWNGRRLEDRIDPAEYDRLVADGYSFAEVADVLGVSRKGLYKYRKGRTDAR